MSGIVGVLGVNGETPEHCFVTRLTRSMAFRGPDRQQSWVGDGVALGHALLSTSLESANEQQPLSLDGQVWIVADARLDARSELLSELQSAGHEFPQGAADAEFILRAYATWGEACLEHLLGDFCFAIWDGRRKSLFCAHDQLGIKPFYYAKTKRWLVFSNTLDCVRMEPEVSAGLNELAVADFLLFGSNQEPATTIFAGIRRLPPAHALSWCGGELSVKRYWTPPADEEIRYKRPEEYEERFRYLLQAAVKDRLRTDRVAVSMSGGLDSSSVAVFARRAGIDDLRAVTVVYDKIMQDGERHYAGLVGSSLGMPIEYLKGDDYVTTAQPDFHEIRSSQPEDDVLVALTTDFYKLASGMSRILLTGEGGDVVLFPSNSHFRRLLSAGRLGRLLHDGARYAISQGGLPPMGVRTLLRRRFGLFDPWHRDYPEWLRPDFESRWQLRQRWEEKSLPPAPQPHPHRPEAVGLLVAPFWQNVFESCDPGSTRVCLEQVHPYFDLRLLVFLFSVPSVPWMLDKYLLRSSLRGMLPEAVRLRPKTPLAGDPGLMFVQDNRALFSRVPSNVGAFLDRRSYEAFVQSPAAFQRKSYEFSVRPTMLSAWAEQYRCSSGELSFAPV